MFTNTSFDRFQTRDSFIHELDPRVKIGVTLLILLSNVLLPDGAWMAFFLTWLFLLGITMLSKIRVSFLLKGSLIALPFALAAFTILFTQPGDPLASFSIGSWIFTISDAGLIRFGSILIRSWLSVQAAILLTSTTKFQDMAHSLRHMGAPYILITIISFMYRYLFVLSNEANRLLRARSARSAELPDSKRPPVSWQAKVAGSMIGQLFLRSYDRSDRVFNAMLARGFRGEFLTFTHHKMNTSDWAALLLSMVMLLSLQFVTRAFF